MTGLPESSPELNAGAPLAAVLDGLRSRRAGLEAQRRELAMLLKQASSEIDRVSQRARDAAGQLRQVEANLEAFSHADVKRAYTTAQEAQMRQFMMQNQLEQLRGRLQNLDSMDDLLNQLIGTVAALSDTIETEPRASSRAGEEAAADGQETLSRPLAEKLFRSIELAQHRLSRQLQDETAQTLSDLILRAEVCERLVELDRQKAKGEVTRLKLAASAALKSTRQFVQELRSPALEEFGLATALRRYAESMHASDKLKVDLQVTGLERRLPDGAEIAIFRIAQEALSNAASHSGAGRAELTLRYEAERIQVSVADMGRGFDVQKALQDGRERGESGLVNMQLRAELIGGILDVDSTPGSGSTVTITVPS